MLESLHLLFVPFWVSVTKVLPAATIFTCFRKLFRSFVTAAVLSQLTLVFQQQGRGSEAVLSLDFLSALEVGICLTCTSHHLDHLAPTCWQISEQLYKCEGLTELHENEGLSPAVILQTRNIIFCCNAN